MRQWPDSLLERPAGAISTILLERRMGAITTERCGYRGHGPLPRVWISIVGAPRGRDYHRTTWLSRARPAPTVLAVLLERPMGAITTERCGYRGHGPLPRVWISIVGAPRGRDYHRTMWLSRAWPAPTGLDQHCPPSAAATRSFFARCEWRHSNSPARHRATASNTLCGCARSPPCPAPPRAAGNRTRRS